MHEALGRFTTTLRIGHFKKNYQYARCIACTSCWKNSFGLTLGSGYSVAGKEYLDHDRLYLKSSSQII